MARVVDYRKYHCEVTSAIEFYRKLEDEGEAQEIEKVLFDVETEIQGLENDLNNGSCFLENSDTFNRMDQTMMVRHLLTKETTAYSCWPSKVSLQVQISEGPLQMGKRNR